MNPSLSIFDLPVSRQYRRLINKIKFRPGFHLFNIYIKTDNVQSMVIDEALLFSNGAEMLDYKMNEIIFEEGSQPNYYYQIVRGTVKLNNYHEDGKEFIQSVPFSGHCFGETFLFSDMNYPLNAVAMEDSEIIRIPKMKFIELVKNNPDSLFNLYCYTAERMYFRYRMLNSLSIRDPLGKVKQVMDCLKIFHKKSQQYSYQIPFTRQQLASLTGLRIETVIRVVKKMEKLRIVKIENGKIYY